MDIIKSYIISYILGIILLIIINIIIKIKDNIEYKKIIKMKDKGEIK